MSKPSISPLLLEQFIAGELHGDVRRQIEERLENDIQLQDAVKQMREDNRQFTERFPFRGTDL